MVSDCDWCCGEVGGEETEEELRSEAPSICILWCRGGGIVIATIFAEATCLCQDCDIAFYQGSNGRHEHMKVYRQFRG